MNEQEFQQALEAHQQEQNNINQQNVVHHQHQHVRMSIKVPEPKRFNGDSQRIDNWLYQLRLYFNANQWEFDGDDSERCASFTAALLEGPALQWHHRQSLRGIVPAHFPQLEQALKQQFGVLDVQSNCRDQLKTLVQNGSVADYIRKFEQVIMHLPTATNEELVHAFTYGLKDHIRRQVKLANPHTVDQAQTAALTVDDRYAPPKGFRPNNNNRRQQQYSSRGARYESVDESVPMEIGNMQRKGKRNKQRSGGYSNNRGRYNNSNYRKGNNGKKGPPSPCNHCGEWHWAQECPHRPNKGKQPQQQRRQRQYNNMPLVDCESDSETSDHSTPCANCPNCQQNLDRPGPSN